ncbi:hypothetical protein GUITHDRAFT_101985 [Guillardia theta CCMP2712]|uniref:Uncharacterized protein n=1 Tax=Guillardia theta (strain CCMP2712) TaxID=905079 RepID=L1JUJ0_GUITC|nr:hypothetical protein GUITHDRAFT_101985 [Guillardia theta CCMP2712]EKX52082.1 hypothetical protein GUITHDRAFT_101985 [Guillardia theta CCMP2712]|eukprot:XP_005839062.1 hypothetical protein GUITHDRAFT_101985 [Guillardia theta CCMP2712]
MADDGAAATTTISHDDKASAEDKVSAAEDNTQPSKRLKVSDPSETTETMTSHRPEHDKDEASVEARANTSSVESSAGDNEEHGMKVLMMVCLVVVLEHSGVLERLSKIQTFECQTAGCSGKLTIDEDICKVGHGVIVIWSSHVSWCDGGQPPCKQTLGNSKLDEFLEARASDFSHEPFALQDVKEKEENGASKRDGAEDVEEKKVDNSKADKFKNLQEEIANICEKEQKYIFCGDAESMQGWVEHVKDVQKRSLLCDLRQTVSTSSESSQPNDTNELFAAVARGEMEKLCRMLAQDARSNFPLHWAASAGSTAICRILLDQGADSNAASEKGDTPLHVAAAHGRMGVVQLLVSRGADLDKQNQDGITARQLLNVLTEANCA